MSRVKGRSQSRAMIAMPSSDEIAIVASYAVRNTVRISKASAVYSRLGLGNL